MSFGKRLGPVTRALLRTWLVRSCVWWHRHGTFFACRACLDAARSISNPTAPAAESSHT